MPTSNCSRLPARSLWTISLTGFLIGPWPGQPPVMAAVKVEKRLLIVAARGDHKVLAPFVTHKKTLLPTELVALEDVLKGSKGADDAEKLKRYLYDRWKTDQVGYVLLVGDAEVIPVRYAAVNSSKTWTFLPSDLYYSDLARRDGSFDDWNARTDGFHAGYYGELVGFDGKGPINQDGIDYLPEVAVGRWPVHNRVQLQRVISKTIKYETHALADDLPAARRSALVIGPNFVDARSDHHPRRPDVEGDRVPTSPPALQGRGPG